MKIVGIIPARYASSRFPGKPLVMIGEKSMIQRVYEQCSKCAGLSEVIVATDDERISAHVESFGGKAEMTDSKHRSGTDRCAEVADRLDAYEAVINIQGDEPFIKPEQILQIVDLLKKGSGIATLAIPLNDEVQASDPNKVKVVRDQRGDALYFSRSLIPHSRDGAENHYLKHLGIYGYRTAVLSQLVELPESELEKREKLEQLRWLDHGYAISVGITEYESPSIDSPDDLELLLKKLGG